MNKILIILTLLAGLSISCGNAEHSTTGASNQTEAQVQHIDATIFQNLMTQENYVVLDVRTKGEINEGYIKGADLFIDVNSSSFSDEINKLDKSKSYLVYCRSGARSTKAATFMVNNGFDQVYNLKGGIMNYRGELSK